MTDEETISRKLLIEQIKRETLDQLREYIVGDCKDGEMTVKRSTGDWDGVLLLIPYDKYTELFKE